MVVSGTQQGFKFEFTYLLSSPHGPCLTRGLQTWPWEGCRGNWLAAWGLYLISKECTGRSCIPCRSRNPHSSRCRPASRSPSEPRHCPSRRSAAVAARAACGKQYVWLSLPEQKSIFCLLLCQRCRESPWI